MTIASSKALECADYLEKNPADQGCIWNDVIADHLHQNLEDHLPETSDLAVYQDNSILRYDYDREEWSEDDEFGLAIGDYYCTFHNDGKINFYSYYAVLEEKPSPDGSIDWWEFGEDGVTLCSGDFARCSKYVEDEWQPE